MIEFIIKKNEYFLLEYKYKHYTYYIYTIYLHYIICLLHTYISKCVRNDVHNIIK